MFFYILIIRWVVNVKISEMIDGFIETTAKLSITLMLLFIGMCLSKINSFVLFY